MKGAIESADFCALKFQKKKNLEHNEWYRLLRVSIAHLQKFVMSDYATGLTFNFHGEDQWNALIDGSIPSSTHTHKEAPKQE